MDKRKGIILAIVLFLLVGLGTFVFAGGSEDVASGQGNNVNDSSEDENGGQITPNEDGESEEEGEQAVSGGGSSAGDNFNDNSTGDNLNDGEGNPTDDVKIDYLALLNDLSKKLENAKNKEDIKDAISFRDENQLNENIADLNNSEATKLLEEINKVLNDSKEPVVNPDDLNNKFFKDAVSVSVDDENKVNVVLKLNGKVVENPDLSNINVDENEEGYFELTVTDEAFNETVVTFIIDRINPVANVSNGEHFDAAKEIEFSDNNISKVVVENRDKLHAGEDYITEYTNVEDGKIIVTLSDEATYLIKVYDEAGNESSYWVAVDTTNPDIVFLGENENKLKKLTNEKSVLIEVYDKFLTEVIVDGPDGKVVYTYANKNDEYFETLNNNEERYFRLIVEEDGVYTVTAKDKVGRVTTEEIEIDTKSIEVNHLYTLNNTHNDYNLVEENRYKVIGNGQDLYVELVLKEAFESIPTIKVGNGEEKVMTCKVASWDSKLFKCDAHITITEDMGLKNGEALTFDIKGIFDEAGNETVLDETYFDDKDLSDTKYGEVIYDIEAPIYNKLTILNVTHLRENNDGGKEDITLVNVGDEIRVLFNFKEKLMIEPVIKIGDVEKTLKLNTNYNNFGKYTYYADIKVTSDMFDADGELDFEISDYADIAGNTPDEKLTLSNIDRTKYTGVVVDTTGPDVKLYKWFIDREDYELKEPGNHNYCVVVEATDENGIKSITLNGNEHTNGALICKHGSYELIAVDNAGNPKPIKFKIDTKYADLYINGDVYSTSDMKNIHYYSKITDIKIEGAEDGIVRLINKDGKRIIDENYSETVIEKIKEQLKVAGYYDFHIIDDSGNNTYVKIFTDGENPVINSASVKSSINYVTINVEDEQTHKVSEKDFEITAGYTKIPNVILNVNATDNYGLDKIYFSETDSYEDAKWLDLKADGIYEYTLENQNEGLKTIYIFVKDFAGNIAKTSVEITYDVTPSSLIQNGTEVEIKNGETYYYNGRFDATANDSSGILVKTMNNKVRDNISASGLNLGYTFVVVDNAGNIATFKVVLDNKNPIVSINGTEYTGINSKKFYFQSITDFNISDNSEIKSIKINDVEINDIDNYDFTLNGWYVVEVTDKANNKTSLTFAVDNEKSLLYLNGSSSVEVELGEEYFDEGAIAIDNIDGEIYLTPVEIKFNTVVDASTSEEIENYKFDRLGVYKLTYKYTDKAGNVGVKHNNSNLEGVVRTVKVVDTTPVKVEGVSSNTTYYGSIDFIMSDKDDFVIYYDFENNYQNCEDLIENGKRFPESNDEMISSSDGFDDNYVIENDVDNVSVCIVDRSGNKTFFHNINLRKEVTTDKLISDINNGGTIVLPENQEIVLSQTLNIPEGTTIIGNGSTINGGIRINAKNVTLNNLNVVNNTTAVSVGNGAQNLVIDGGYFETKHGEYGAGTIRLDFTSGETFNSNITIVNTKISGALHVLNYSGSLANIKNNEIDVKTIEGNPLIGLLILADSATRYSEDEYKMLLENNDVTMTYHEGTADYYVAIQIENEGGKWVNVYGEPVK